MEEKLGQSTPLTGDADDLRDLAEGQVCTIIQFRQPILMRCQKFAVAIQQHGKSQILGHSQPPPACKSHLLYKYTRFSAACQALFLRETAQI